MIKITSKHDGFIRCGVRHSYTATDHADDRFSEEEMAVLEAEPMLIVQHMDDPQEQDEYVPEMVNDKPIWPEKEFRALDFDGAKYMASQLYGVTGRSWDGLWKDFSEAQDKHIADSKE